jgi:hypothetical protein
VSDQGNNFELSNIDQPYLSSMIGNLVASWPSRPSEIAKATKKSRSGT